MGQGASGANLAISAKVIGIRSMFVVSGTDSTSSTLTIDNAPPAEVTVTNAASTSTTQIRLDWTKPADATNVVVFRSQSGPVSVSLTDGQAATGAVYTGSGAFYENAVGGLTNGQPYYFKIFTQDACGNYSSGLDVGPIYAGTMTEGALAGTGPVVGILNPGPGPVTLPLKVQVRIFSPSATALSNFIAEFRGTSSKDIPLVRNPNYGAGAATDSGIFEATVTSTDISNVAGSVYTIRARATNGGGANTVYSGPVGIRIATKGDGNLLVRENSNQLCGDCHNVQTHSSEATGTKYGSWYAGCRTCHTPHGTTNASLVSERITPPARTGQLPPSQVVFSTHTGYVTAGGAANASIASYANGDKTGVCQVCHTQTTKAYKRDGTLVDHYPNNNCSGCHKHDKGFAATCSTCHGVGGRLPNSGVTGTDALLAAYPPAVQTKSSAPVVANGGLHEQHANKNTIRENALQCDECHQNFQHGDGDVDLGWNSSLAGADGAVVDPTGIVTAAWVLNPTCTNYCHGSTLADGSPATKITNIRWNQTQTLGCGACHGYPPLTIHDGSAHPSAPSGCATCHAGYTSPTLAVAAKITHINGKVEATGCTGCHGDESRAAVGTAVLGDIQMAPPKPYGGTTSDAITVRGVGLHQLHVNTLAIVSEQVACNECHPIPNTHAATAGAEEANISFGPTANKLGNASWNVTTLPSLTGTCTSVYCHNPTPATPGSTPRPNFYSSTTNLGCTGCHADQTTSLSTGAHEMHVTDVGSYKGTTFGCATCHNTADNGTILNKAQHVDGAVSTVGTGGDTSFVKANGACGTSLCHSKGTEVTNDYVSANWSATTAAVGGTCKECHGAEAGGLLGAPWYANGFPDTNTANSHDKHVKATDTTAVCNKCHATTVTAAGALVGSVHLDFIGPVDVAWNTTTMSGYDAATESCTSISCHAFKNAQWGATLSCADCHTNPTNDTDSFAFGTAGVISESQWTNSGHGQASFGTNTFPTIAAGKPCLYCHDPSVDHDVAGNPYRLIGVTTAVPAGGIQAGNYSALTATSANQVCLNCHATSGANGVNASAQGLKTSTKKIDAYHYGADHGARTGGYRCWDCHDPHGDGNLKMVGSKVVQSSTDNHSWAATRITGVSFTANATGTDYANATVTSLCRACHVTAAHYNLTTNDGHQSGTKCLGCHGHNQTPNLAFMNINATGSCTGCHSTPPANGKHAAHDSTTFSETVYNNNARHADAANYGYACYTCHQGTHMNDPSSPYGVEVTFGNFDAQAVGGAYVAGVAQPGDSTANAALTFNWTAGTCNSTYCHTNGSPVGGTVRYNAVSWNEAAWTAANKCTKCHSMSATTTVPDSNLSHSHNSHIAATASSGYFYNCSTCHNGVATGKSDFPTTAGSIVSKTLHANGTTHTVAFDPAVNPGATGYVAGTYTCNNTYCHSAGTTTAFVANASIAWNSTAGTTCSSCHLGYTGTIMATGKHAEHVNNTTDLGTNYQCDDCHVTTVGGGAVPTVLYAGGKHVDKVRDVAIQDRLGQVSGNTGTTCSNTYCHSEGQRGPAANNTRYSVTWSETTWTGNICLKCHGNNGGTTFGAPDYANGGANTATANSHGKHVDANTDCATCHFQMVNANATAIAGSLHTDGVIDVLFNKTIAGTNVINTDGSFTAPSTYVSNTCTSIACHGVNTAAVSWGATLDCSACHMGAATGAAVDTEVDDYTYNNGTFAKLDPENWITYGHGRPTASGAYDSTLPAAGFDTAIAVSADDGCKYCHDRNVPHGVFGTSTNPFRLANIVDLPSDADATVGNSIEEKVRVCTICHDGGGGYLGKTTNVSSKVIGANHYGTRHSTGGKGGELCWDCHDPHGDYNFGASQVLAYMFDKQPVKTRSVTVAGSQTEWGQTGLTYAATPSFFANRDGTATWGWGDYVVTTTNNGVCQVCHATTTPNFNTATYTAGHYNTSGRCTSCHAHDQGTTDAFKQQGCNGCHGDSTRAAVAGATTDVQNAPPKPYGGATTDGISVRGVGNHQLHVNSTASVSDPIACNECHPIPNTHAATAGTEEANILFGTVATHNPGATWNATTLNCTSVYCHNPTPATPGATPVVGFYTTATTLGCNGCHRDATTLNSGAHDLHVVDASGYKGTVVHCDDCHSTANNTTILVKAQHIDGAVSFQATETFAGGSCTASKCHKDGTETPGYVSVNWTSTTAVAGGTCSECHGTATGAGTWVPAWGEPNYPERVTTSNDVRNSHGKHLSSNAAVAKTQCVSCHQSTIDGTGALVANGTHLSGTVEITSGAGTKILGGYTDATETCATITCHGGTNAVWGTGPIACGVCHAGAPPMAAGSSRRTVAAEFTATWSHKRSGGKSASAADCTVCHMEGQDPNAVPVETSATYHADGIIDLRDPDTGLHIKGVTFVGGTTEPGYYTSTASDATFTRFSRNLATRTIEPAVAAIMINQCLKCHDSNGAASTLGRIGAVAAKPFNTTITTTAAYYGAGVTANGTTGGVTDINASLATTNSSYHPVRGTQNNWYARTTRMWTPWNVTRTGTTMGTTSYGALLSCWDCHAPNGTGSTVTLTTTVTAHGGATTLRGNATASGTAPTATTGSTLCKVCHRGYEEQTSSMHGAGSAFTGNGQSPMNTYTRYGCNRCHSGGYETIPLRPLKAQDTHGVNALPATGTKTLRWSTTQGSPPQLDTRPYAFIRNTTTLSNYSPRRIGGSTYTPNCTHLNSPDGQCSSRSESPGTGGTF
jgi:predicted CxxxxCH...CXXCH cytochrome family protein